MGKLTLLLVLAAVVGGSLLTVHMRGTLGESSRRHSEDQADLLAREIAESGQSLALSRMMGANGFVDPKMKGERAYDGGNFRIDVDEITPDGKRATITVEGNYGGAVHRIQSTYEFDPMDVPGPIWLDVPYATTSAGGAAKFVTDAAHPVRFDRRQHDALQLGSNGFLPLSGLQNGINGALNAVGTTFQIPAANQWTGLLEDLNVQDTEGLYQSAMAAFNPSTDTKLVGDQVITSSVTWGNPDAITYVQGDLTVGSGTVKGRVRGEGALVIGGSLRVDQKGELDWTGLVIVRDTAQVIDVDLKGKVDITGALAVAQQAFPPGGHLDVSVYRDAGGMQSSIPQGDTSPRLSPWDDGQPWPWHQHTHAFDVTPAGAERGQHVYFMEGGGDGRHEAETQFHDLIQSLGSESVYLEFGNPTHHGYARYTLDIDGLPSVLTGSARTGFGGFASAGNVNRSKPFSADDLEAFDLNVLSLRSLRKSFDGTGGCGDWPICTGFEWDRKGAFALRVVRASDNRRLYEATFYWHMRPDEKATHDAEEQAWRNKITSGNEFGTHLKLGSKTRFTFDLAPIVALSDKMGFDGNEIIHIATSSSHQTAAEARAANINNGNAYAYGQNGGNGTKSGNGTPAPAITPTPSQPIPTNPNQKVKVCRPPTGGDTSWNEVEMKFKDVLNYLLGNPGARYGTCSDHGL